MLADSAVLVLIQEATARAAVPFDPQGAHRLIIKSVSSKQRPRRPAQKASPTPRAKSRKTKKE